MSNRRSIEDADRDYDEQINGRPADDAGAAPGADGEPVRTLADINTARLARLTDLAKKNGGEVPDIGVAAPTAEAVNPVTETEPVLANTSRRYMCVPIKCVETGVIYKNALAAAKIFGRAPNNLSRVLDRPDRTFAGKHFVRVIPDPVDSAAPTPAAEAVAPRPRKPRPVMAITPPDAPATLAAPAVAVSLPRLIAVGVLALQRGDPTTPLSVDRVELIARWAERHWTTHAAVERLLRDERVAIVLEGDQPRLVEAA